MKIKLNNLPEISSDERSDETSDETSDDNDDGDDDNDDDDDDKKFFGPFNEHDKAKEIEKIKTSNTCPKKWLTNLKSF